MAPMSRDELICLHARLTNDARNLMSLKNQDYGATSDIFRNFRRHGTIGIMVRLSDKLSRLETYIERGSFMVGDEKLEDTVMDAINYLVILVGYLQEQGSREPKTPPSNSHADTLPEISERPPDSPLQRSEDLSNLPEILGGLRG